MYNQQLACKTKKDEEDTQEYELRQEGDTRLE